MTTKRGSIHFAIPLPVAVDPASLERLTKVITDAHAAIGAFTAAIAGLGGKVEYRPKAERKKDAGLPTHEDVRGILGPARPITDAGTAGVPPTTGVTDAFAIPAGLRKELA